MKAISTLVDVFDSNNKICIYDLLNKEQKKILSQAHDMKTLMVMNSELKDVIIAILGALEINDANAVIGDVI